MLNNQTGLRTEDLALDCIADLFQRSDSGALVQVRAYFASFDLDSSDEDETLAHLRRLVFARVNQSIFRIYQDIDPSFAKILRNIKIAIDALQNFAVSTRFGHISITPVLTDEHVELPDVSPHILVVALKDAGASPQDTVPMMLSRLSIWLREQQEYRRVVPITVVAQAIRSIYQGKSVGGAVAGGAVPDSSLTESEIISMLESACARIKLEMASAYVSKGKLDVSAYDLSFNAIRTRLLQVYVQRDGESSSYFDEIHRHAPEISYEDYRSDHRKRVEYLGRLVEKEFVKLIKNEI